MKALLLLCLFTILLFSLPSYHTQKVRNLNFLIQEQQEEMYRKRLEVRKLWLEKNMAWNELNRSRR